MDGSAVTSNWAPSAIPSQAGRVAIVTGANRGLGLEVAYELARAGATVVLACRNAARAAGAVESVRARVPHAKLERRAVDLGDLVSVRRFAADCARDFPKAHLLVNNAAAILQPRGKTKDGFEMHMGVNHLGAFALTGLLLPLLASSGDGRVVNTSSLAHKMAKRFDVDDLAYERGAYVEMEAYGRSKWAALLFTFELDRRLKAAGLPVKAMAAHPGWSNTNPDQGSLWMRALNGLMAQPAAQGAWPALYAATMPDVQGGDYFGPGGLGELRGGPKRVTARPEARDAALASRLWAASEKLTGVSYLD